MSDETTTLSTFFEAWELFATPALTGAMAGLLLGVVGVYVVLRRLVFLTAAVSQAAGLGVALAFWAQVSLGIPALLASPLLGSVLLTCLAVLPAASERGLPSVRRDSLLGIGYLVGTAGTLALGTRIVQEIQDIETLLFGSAVAVLPESLHLLAGVGAAVLALHAWWWRGFSAVSFDPAGARVRGLPVRLVDLVLFATLALSISVSTRILGALPVFAFSVLPAVAAVRLAPSVPWALIFSGALGAVMGFGGYLAAFVWQLPVGAAQTLVGASLVALAEVARLARPGR